MSDFEHPERMSTKVLVDILQGYSIGLRASGDIAGSSIVKIAADRLAELEEKLHGISDQEHQTEVYVYSE